MNLRNRSQSNKKNLRIKNIQVLKAATGKKRRFTDPGNGKSGVIEGFRRKKADRKLYFVQEKKAQLPNDMMKLVKLDLVKDDTIWNYEKEISKLKQKIIRSELGEGGKEKKRLKQKETELQQNNQFLNEEMQNSVLEEKRILDIGKELVLKK